jgi:hypothetical protein
MKKYLLAAAVVSVALAVPAAFGASTPKLTGSGGSPGDARYQQGGVAVPFSVNVTAQGTPSSATGNFTFTRADGSFGGTVDCYAQTGNTGLATGLITQASGIYSDLIGQNQGFVVNVQDNGQGGGASPDKIQVDIWTYASNLCTYYFSNPVFPYVVTTGNFQVH